MAPNIKAVRMIQGAIVPIVERLPHGSRAHKRISSGVCPHSTVIPISEITSHPIAIFPVRLTIVSV